MVRVSGYSRQQVICLINQYRDTLNRIERIDVVQHASPEDRGSSAGLLEPGQSGKYLTDTSGEKRSSEAVNTQQFSL